MHICKCFFFFSLYHLPEDNSHARARTHTHTHTHRCLLSCSATISETLLVWQVLYYCFTTVLYYCFTAALLLLYYQ